MTRILPFLAFAALVGLNLIPFERGSIAFEDWEGFSRPRGWPFRALAGANDEGARLVEASVVQGDTRVIRGVLGGPYPHLAWNPFFLATDLVLAILVAWAFRVLVRLRANDARDLTDGAGSSGRASLRLREASGRGS